MKNSDVTNYKSQLENLDQALDILYSAPTEDKIKHAQTRLTHMLETSKQEAILYGQFEHQAVGMLFLAMRKNMLVTINFGIAEEDFILQIEKQFKEPIYFAQNETTTAIRQVQDYLNGERTSFDLATNLSILTKFQQQVLEATQQIPRGRIATYMDIARKIGNPKAVRAVGQALGRNPIPIVIPCHRVIASNGTLGGYSGGGGLETKAKLLRLEGVSLI